MTIIRADLPPREVEGADEVLQGAVAQLSSGNFCRFWPALTYDHDQTRIAFFVEWYRPATPNDQAELTAYTNKVMGGPPALAVETSGDPTRDEGNIEWLRTGKPPKPGRTN